MDKGMKASIGLSMKVLIILLLPLLLFRYVDSQPRIILEEESSIRSVAIVNEDTGYESELQSINLGHEIPILLKDQEDYSWTVVNRSTAEQGLANKNYDAIMYIPSNYSKNIMTFKENQPTKASLHYVIQPNLEAKERQRIHRQMANAKNIINQEMISLYWNYVSQQVNHIRDQFDLIVEKEIAFQDAMYSFYTPSSKTLAYEIDVHKSNLKNILKDTSQVDEISSSNVHTAEKVENKMKSFAKALNEYKETQKKQQRLLEIYLDENQEAFHEGLTRYHQALEESITSIEEQFKQQSVLFKENRNQLSGNFEHLKNNVVHGRNYVDKWNEIQAKKYELLLLKINTYKDKFLNEPNTKLDKAIRNLKGLKRDIIDIPTAPNVNEVITIDLAKLSEHMAELGKAIDQFSAASEEEPEIPKEDKADWNNIVNNFAKLDTELNALVELQSNNPNPNEIIDVWEEHVNEWNKTYKKLMDQIEEPILKLVNNIEEKQNKILVSKEISDERREFLKGEFEKLKLDNKPLISLIVYSEELSVYMNTLNQKKKVNNDILSVFEKELHTLTTLNSNYYTKLNDVFGKNLNAINSSKSVGEERIGLSELIKNTEDLFASYNDKLNQGKTNIKSIIEEMELGSANITEKLQKINDHTFEWKISPVLEQLDGEMMVEIQQGTMSDLEHMAELLNKLNENQNQITSSTEELQEQVNTVQQQSDELNNKWSQNVASSEKVRNEIYDILGNTIVDGQVNPLVFNYLSNPVQVEGQLNGQVKAETEDRIPPVIMFIIILLSGLLIGFLSNYYSNTSYLVQGGLFLLLNIAVGLIISIYGLNMYSLDNARAMQWSLFTILLLVTCANIVRGGLFIGQFVGWITSMMMIVFFISPLVDLIVPEFRFNNPITDVYISLQYGTGESTYLAMFILALISLLMSALIYTIQQFKNKSKVDEDEEEAL
ncbi:type VII secretion protein EsaA [Virgibacillus sp. M23]|uniref:type VII secretion protein EsaA n=1 Tax=Virgibacillus sp. M23 TaxID=3079030 RepID=UPI002A9142D9|nr:type VII secretion protein EsaA [Virgibacillus sp. M23]MDY7045443.1 type VII secretion protein EsaA [Virgibacillus sp. M23]